MICFCCKQDEQSYFKKHEVSFEEAQTVFFDDMAIQFLDHFHSKKEERFLMLGLSNKLRVLLVVHCFRESDSTIRIISARKATKKERNEYTGGGDMKQEYDFSKMKKHKNPFAKQLKKQVTIRMGVDIIDYFKGMSEETGIPYQNLINLYLRECVINQKKLSFQ